MVNQARFWMIWVEGEGRPVQKHDSFNLARDEAERLAIKHQKMTYVLEAVGSWGTAAPEWNTLTDEDEQ